MQLRSRSVSSVLVTALALALALGLAGCAPVMPAGGQQAGGQPMGGATMQEMAPAATPEPGKLTVVDVRARPAPLEGGNGAAYLTVLNGLDVPVRLASVAGDMAAAVELHETVDDNGVMKMEPHPEGFEIPAGGTLVLKPGGKHVMLLGLVKPLAPGDSIDLTLNFEGSDPISLAVPVLEIEATMPGMDHGSMEGGAMPMATETPEP
jgi:periplasmic copper chaperone A